MRYQINHNGNTKEDISARARKVARAFNDLNEALSEFTSNACHGRNYQTLDNPERERQSDLTHMRSVQKAVMSIQDNFRNNWDGQS